MIGASNRLAISAARAVAGSPGAAYNPLLVYGASGLGKTHLVSAIAHHARIERPELRVEVSTGEELAERLHRAIGAGQQTSFSQRFQDVDLLLLDDVQFLSGQRETQSELLRLFNVLQGKGRQLVLTSDRPPAEIPDVDQRLLSRLSGGLVVDVGNPDYEMRLAILRNVSADREIHAAEGVLEEVARLAYANVRELKGALNKVAAFQQLQNGAIDCSDVRAVLGEQPSAQQTYATQPSHIPQYPVGAEYEGFLADIVQEVETRVEKWRLHLGEACNFWRAEGYATGVLERAMLLSTAPDVNGLLTTFTGAVEHLRELEQQATAIDPSLRANPAFRNPELVATARLLLDRAVASIAPLPSPVPFLTRAALESGTANQLALKAFDAIIENPGKRYNPLFLHGPSGVGKTHIANALGNSMRAAWPARSVTCMTTTAFIDELVAAMQEGAIERWRARFRASDVLILDDVHHLRDKDRSQEELFHIFNHLYDRDCQIVLTSDCAPKSIPGLADRLRTRFTGGLVAHVGPPDRGLREQLVKRWLLESGEDPAQSTVAILADYEAGDVRELGGLVRRCVASAQLGGEALTSDAVRRELGVERITPLFAMASAEGSETVDNFFLDREKTIWDWPDLSSRLNEEMRSW